MNKDFQYISICNRGQTTWLVIEIKPKWWLAANLPPDSTYIQAANVAPREDAAKQLDPKCYEYLYTLAIEQFSLRDTRFVQTAQAKFSDYYF